MRRAIYIIFIFLHLYQFSLGQETKENDQKEFTYDCSTCHTCNKPTKKNPCLNPCPRFELITIYHKAEEGPENIIMKGDYSGRDLYESVLFSHRVHSEMANMAGGCSMCHHYNPPGRILPCKDCHENQRKRTDISKPDLKGAYHRQCMNCHREWQHSTDCLSCHLQRDDNESDRLISLDQSDKKGHAGITEPERILYETDTKEGKLVTFYHEQHKVLFGFECTDCHSNESCVRCHDTRKDKDAKFTSGENGHKSCSKCHNTESQKDCGFCHSSKIKPSFDHLLRSGFALSNYHNELPCGKCHTEKGKFSGINKNCVTCHSSWDNSNFDHKITGLKLDENHIDNDCIDCHVDLNFGKKPTCDNCHDSDIIFPQNLPGEKMRK